MGTDDKLVLEAALESGQGVSTPRREAVTSEKRIQPQHRRRA
jgi:hypothetical protein